ncbi:hypothetical protein H1R17_11630 [Flavobacterium sp. xlx-214]|uniref:NUMOD4 domain-containing protein n=1 Tax=unclassified Flavobacterium TaxID=196869 RepID=UPI0013D8A7ED|nr:MULTISPECIES: NUMOD4 domain-containing protein [unclassified Flavobacterium]MBA5791867.1 hypothetical protein [Flavobacterium sp. xlx-221]QMI83104.1 hypothetical protein H1R17_11630 [Flavobacterium sp. xlx-214]
MLVLYPGEQFKELVLEDKKKLRYAVSNYGRLISFTNEIKEGNLLKPNVTNKLKIFRYKVLKPEGGYAHKHIMLSRAIADFFVNKPSDLHNFVIHLDFDNLNDHYTNLKWVTEEEKYAHQRINPNVKVGHEKSIEKKRLAQKGMKLDTTQVMRIKRMIHDPNRKTRMRIIAKQFGISEMQLYRIKTGENWANVPIPSFKNTDDKDKQ